VEKRECLGRIATSVHDQGGLGGRELAFRVEPPVIVFQSSTHGEGLDMPLHRKSMTRRIVLRGAAATVVSSVAPVRAQSDWPNHPVRLIVPYPREARPTSCSASLRIG